MTNSKNRSVLPRDFLQVSVSDHLCDSIHRPSPPARRLLYSWLLNTYVRYKKKVSIHSLKEVVLRIVSINMQPSCRNSFLIIDPVISRFKNMPVIICTGVYLISTISIYTGTTGWVWARAQDGAGRGFDLAFPTSAYT